MYYVTPARYRTMGTGVDLSSTDDATLASIAQNAAALINAACNAPDGYSFLGGHVDAEEHTWNTGNQYKKASGKLWPFMRPVTEVDEVRINVTPTQYVTFTGNQLFHRGGLDYVTPVAPPTSTALFTSVPPFLISPPVAYVTYDYGFHEVVEDELLTTISGGTLQAANQFWFTDEEVELQKNGVVLDPADYEVDYDEGTVTPDVIPVDGDVFKVSYHHHLPPGIALGTAQVMTDLLGATNIAASGLLGLSGIKVEEIELRQSSKVNFYVQPISAAAAVHVVRYAKMFVSMR